MVILSDLHNHPYAVHECPHRCQRMPSRVGTTVPRRFRFHTRLKSIHELILATVTTNTTKFYCKSFVVLASRSLPIVSRPSRLPRCQYDVATISWADHADVHDFSDGRDRDRQIGTVWPGLNRGVRGLESRPGWCYFPLYKVFVVSRTTVYGRNGCCCQRTVDISYVTLRPRQNGRHFTDDILKCIFLNENNWIWIRISLKFVPKVPINNIPALVQIMAWRRPGEKPLSEPMMI